MRGPAATPKLSSMDEGFPRASSVAPPKLDPEDNRGSHSDEIRHRLTWGLATSSKFLEAVLTRRYNPRKLWRPRSCIRGPGDLTIHARNSLHRRESSDYRTPRSTAPADSMFCRSIGKR